MSESRNSAAAVNSRPDPNEKLVKVFDTEQESEALVVKGLRTHGGRRGFILSAKLKHPGAPANL